MSSTRTLAHETQPLPSALVLREALARTDLDPADVDEVMLGNANGAGEDNRNVARMASLLAGLPVSVHGTSVNRLCGSSLDAAMIGSRAIETGDANIVLTGGVESMTRAPWVLPKPERAFPAGAARCDERRAILLQARYKCPGNLDVCAGQHGSVSQYYDI